MIKITATALVAAGTLLTSGVFAGDNAAGNAGSVQTIANAGQPCADLTALNLTADQKAKIEAWQADCVKAGCTKQNRRKFFQQAKGILSAEQFAKLKAECKRNRKQAKTQT
jgi:hypothetical protein